MGGVKATEAMTLTEVQPLIDRLHCSYSRCMKYQLGRDHDTVAAPLPHTLNVLPSDSCSAPAKAPRQTVTFQEEPQLFYISIYCSAESILCY